ncbi:hypothetical protein NC653_006249 [Populus alba x Populus x berolinensis]|uniref:Uncharacterized protein n=1 Tax=Populus alba x Populus x berolinensis TaxID=444605 RepID=A0AAD6REB9_9ROSI|nr:hypothetical protein NC653_006249 [Populus alba x Populus x berolinensis]
MFNCKFAMKYLVLFFLIPTEFATTRTITTRERKIHLCSKFVAAELLRSQI